MATTKQPKKEPAAHEEDVRSKTTQAVEELAQLAKESREQKLPEQKVVFKTDSIKSRAGRRGVHNLPDQTNPPMGFDPDKAFDAAFPFLKLPYLQPNTPEDVISFGSPDAGGFLDPKTKKVPLNAIFFGDNLHVLRALPSNCVDLIYIDPPFFSGRNYNQLWGDDNEIRTFHDIWEDGLPSYLVWLNARLWEMRRVLKDTGSIYVHCDWHASHYIKCEMDKIFGYENFVNEVAWAYRTQGATKRRWSRKHDILLFYAKTENRTFNHMTERSYMQHKYGFAKEDFKIDEEGRQYRDALVRDIWEIAALQSATKESIGYPTQKPEALLERVIKASSNEGDVVADFFMGGGTTCGVAQKLNRKFIGCDISRVASSVALNRLIRDAEDISGRTASLPTKKTEKEQQLSLELTIKKVPDIHVYYMGVYVMLPIFQAGTNRV